MKESVCHGQIVRENIDAQAASTDGRVTLYANDQAHLWIAEGRFRTEKELPEQTLGHIQHTCEAFISSAH